MNLDELAGRYHQQALASSDARDYYAKWGLDIHQMVKFQLGWCNEPLIKPHDGLRNLPLVPYRVAGGLVVAIRMNAFEHDQVGLHDRGYIANDYPLAAPEGRLFNVADALPGLRTDRVMLVEEVHSAVIADQCGWRAVAAPGFDNWFDPWNYLFEESKVHLVAAGARELPARRVAGSLERYGVDVTIYLIPKERTYGELFLAEGNNCEQTNIDLDKYQDAS